MKFLNATRGVTLADNGRSATSFLARGKGLLGTKDLPSGEGLLIKPCQSIHTFFMSYPIDVLFLDKQLRVVHMCQSIPPNRASRLVWRSRCVIELPSGTIARTGTKIGDLLEIEAEGS